MPASWSVVIFPSVRPWDLGHSAWPVCVFTVPKEEGHGWSWPVTHGKSSHPEKQRAALSPDMPPAQGMLTLGANTKPLKQQGSEKKTPHESHSHPEERQSSGQAQPQRHFQGRFLWDVQINFQEMSVIRQDVEQRNIGLITRFCFNNCMTVN